jgi:ATP-dependent DNA helicase
MVSASTTTADTESHKPTPASSPPSVEMEDADHGVSKQMLAEEEQMRLRREKEDAKREAQLEKERKDDLEGGKEVLDSKFKALEHLMNKSKVGDMRDRSDNSRCLARRISAFCPHC